MNLYAVNEAKSCKVTKSMFIPRLRDSLSQNHAHGTFTVRSLSKTKDQLYFKKIIFEKTFFKTLSFIKNNENVTWIRFLRKKSELTKIKF
jgi:hypothetical protein